MRGHRAATTIATWLAMTLSLAGWPNAVTLATTPSAPTVSSTSHSVSAWSTDNTVDVVWSAGGASVDGWSREWSQYSVSGAPEQFQLAGTTPGTTSDPLTDGSWYVNVRFHESGGGWSNHTQVGPFWIDTTPPSTGSLNPDSEHPPGSTPSSDRTIGITWSAASDPYPIGPGSPSGAAGRSFEWSASATPIVPDEVVDDGPGQGGTGSEPLPDGTWYFYMRAVDNAGNWSPAYRIGPFVIAAYPTVTINSGPEHESANNPSTVTFGFSTSSAQLTLQCSLDNAAFAACTSPKTFTNLSVGVHRFQVRGKNASNETVASDERSFWVGPLPPPPPEWSTPATVAPAGTSDATHPSAQSVAFAPDGSLHAAYIVPNGTLRGLYYATNKTGAWQSSKIADASTLGDEWTSIDVDSAGRAHVVYQNISTGVFYLTNATGAWVKKKLTGGTGLVVYPEITVDSNRRAHVVYFVPGGSPGLRYATNASGSWVTKRVTTSAFDISADIALDANRKVHIVYGRANKGFRYLTNKSGSWAGGYVVAGITSSRPPAIAIDSLGRPVVAFVNSSSSSSVAIGTWSSVKTSGGWVATQVVSYASLRVEIRAGAAGSAQLVAFSGGQYYSNQGGPWRESAAAPAYGNTKVAFDVGPAGQLAIVFSNTSRGLGVVVAGP